MELTKEILDKVRNIDGFPIGRDEDIIALSQPPYYTACPNPFIEDFIGQNGKPYDETADNYHREPFAADVSEGKNDPIYNAHSYHTKVPHKAIMRYILHYTEPGDVVFDGFCGTGMTGVAAQMCARPDPAFKLRIENEMPYVRWGARKAVLCDLSPAATFIAYNYNTPVDVAEFRAEAQRILDEVERECGWMYETMHTFKGEQQFGLEDKPIMGKINYTVWSDVFVCPNCSEEIIFWDVAVDKNEGKVADVFHCSHCGAQLKKTDCQRAQQTVYDKALKENHTFAKQVPVLINYTVGKKRYEKAPDQYDMDVLRKIEEMDIPYWYPTDRMPEGYNTEQPKKSHNITNVHHFYTKRNLWVLAALYNRIDAQKDIRRKHLLKFLLQSYNLTHSTIMSRIIFKQHGKKPVLTGNQTGTLYVSSLPVEKNIINGIKIMKINLIKESMSNIRNENYVFTQSATETNIPSNSIDYIFTDPPFGSNLMYSELNFIWEAWLKVFTNNKPEAVVNNVQGKGMVEYQQLMERCFAECYRVLKPGRWMTVEFHNSKNAVWNAIQEAMMRAGFIVADVRTLDKMQGSFKQVTTTSAVKQDLVISAYKPREGFKRRFLEKGGSDEEVWDFVRQHLENLPVVVEKGGKLVEIEERKPYLLFDRMVAYHVVNGIAVPMDAHDFYKGLDAHFVKRDGMYFLSEQANVYDAKRLHMDVEEQLSMIVADEKTAVQWLYRELAKPQAYQELQPKFMQAAHQLRYEKMPELSELLEENFIQDEAGRWYVPDVNKASDLAKLRKKRLLKEFEDYASGSGKLKVFRTEAIRAGFDECWARRDYATIVKVARRLPESVIQDDTAILMYYDNAMSKLGI